MVEFVRRLPSVSVVHVSPCSLNKVVNPSDLLPCDTKKRASYDHRGRCRVGCFSLVHPLVRTVWKGWIDWEWMCPMNGFGRRARGSMNCRMHLASSFIEACTHARMCHRRCRLDPVHALPCCLHLHPGPSLPNPLATFLPSFPSTCWSMQEKQLLD